MADNLRPIIAFIADPANADRLHMFLPEAVMAAAARVAALTKEYEAAAVCISELNAELYEAKEEHAAELRDEISKAKARMPSRPVIAGSMPDECFMYLAGIGYVLVANKAFKTIFRLSGCGEINDIQGVNIPAGPTTYTENQVVATPATSNPAVYTIDFVPCGNYKRIGSLTIKTAAKTTVYTYESYGNWVKLVTRAAKVTKTYFDEGKVTRKSVKVGNVKTITYAGSRRPTIKVRMHPRVTRCTDEDEVTYILEAGDHRIEYTLGSDNIEVLTGPEVAGHMSISGSKYKFHYGDRCDVFAIKGDLLEFLETRQKPAA